jgi:hypothetical protein
MPALLLAGVLAVLLMAVAFRVNKETNSNLQTKLARNMPIAAIYAIRHQGLRGPLFNDFNWGGFLIWWLRMPVSIDGRTNVYGTDSVIRSYKTWGGYPGWDSDPDLLRANLIFAPVNAPLTELLDSQACLQVAYRDNLATVFVQRKTLIDKSNVASSPFCTRRQLATH